MKTTVRLLLGFALWFAAVAAFLPSANAALDTVPQADWSPLVTGFDDMSQGAPDINGVSAWDYRCYKDGGEWASESDDLYFDFTIRPELYNWFMCPNGEMCGNSAHRPYFEIKTGGCFGSGTTVHQRLMNRTGTAGTSPYEYYQGTSWQGASLRKIPYGNLGISEIVATGELPYWGEGPHKVARVLMKNDGSAFLDLDRNDFVAVRNGGLKLVRFNGSGLDYYNVSAALELTKTTTEDVPEGYVAPNDAPLAVVTENFTPGNSQPVFYFAGDNGGSYVLIPYNADGPMLWRQDTGTVTVGGWLGSLDYYTGIVADFMNNLFGLEGGNAGEPSTPHLAGKIPSAILELAANNYFVFYQDPTTFSGALQKKGKNAAGFFEGETSRIVGISSFVNPRLFLMRADGSFGVIDANCFIPGYESCQHDDASQQNMCADTMGNFWTSPTTWARQVCQVAITQNAYYPTGTPTGTGTTSSGVVLPYSDYEPIRDFTGWNGNPSITNQDYLHRCIYLNPDKSKYAKPLQFCPISDFETVNLQYWDRFCGIPATGQPERHFYFWGNYGPVTANGSPSGETQVAVKAGVCATAATATGITDVSLQYQVAGNIIASSFPTIQKTSVYQYQGSNSGSYANRWLGMVNTYARTPADFDNATLLSFFGTDTAAAGSTGTVLPYEDVVFYNVSSPATRNANDPNDPGKTFTYFRSKGPIGDSGDFITTVRALNQLYYTSGSTLTPYDDAYYLPESRPPGQSLTGGTVFGKPQYTQPSNGYKGMFSCDRNADGETTWSEVFSCPSTLADNFTGNFDYATTNWKGMATATSELGNVSKSQYSRGVFGEQEHSSNPMIENIVKALSFDSAINSKWSDDNKFVRFAKYVFWMVLASILVLATVFFRKER